VAGQSNTNFISYYETQQFNCTIARVIQGEWYSREKNLDTVTIVDATTMTRRGEKIGNALCKMTNDSVY
jgi:hypothetical protein